MSYEIETGFQVPEKATKRGKTEKYAFDKLEEGQSFFVPDSDVPSGNAVKSLRSTAYQKEKKSKTNARFVVFTATKEIEGVEVNGARILRKDNK